MDWSNQDYVCTLIRSLAFGNGHAKYGAYGVLDSFDHGAFQALAPDTLTQNVVGRSESRTIEAYLASALVAAVRDFTDTNTGVDAACDGIEAAVLVGDRSRGVRKAMRRQIRRTLDCSRWNADRDDSIHWQCSFCGVTVEDDGEGYPRRSHLNDAHPMALPARHDTGCANRWNRGFVRGHLLLLLAGLLRGKSWPNHRRYFEGKAWEALNEHFADQSAGKMPSDQYVHLLH